MANSSSVQPWILTMPQGSLQQWLFTFTTVIAATGQGAPYPIAGWTWEYVARTTAGDTGPPLISLTPTVTPQGVLAVTATSAVSSVLLDIYAPATAGLSPGTYYHALWANPGTSSAFCWWTGSLIISGTPQP